MSRLEYHRIRRKKTERKIIRMFSGGVIAVVLICACILIWNAAADDAAEREAAGSSKPAETGGPAQPDNSGGTSRPDGQKLTADGEKPQQDNGGSPRQPDGEKPQPADGDTPQPQKKHVSLSFVGDVMFSGKLAPLLEQKGYDYPFAYVKSYLEKADIAAANLETPITTRGTEQQKEYVYRSSPSAVQAMKRSGIDVVNLANNHILDYGQVGLADTLDYLDQERLLRVGAGSDADEAYRPAIVEKNGLKIAFLGFSRVVPEGGWKAGKSRPGVAETYNYTVPVESIRKAKAAADLVVVIVHWGVEKKDKPESYQIELAHRYVDAGADLVVGSHPHVLQGFERYKGKWIAYSLGNFIFTTSTFAPSWETAILEADCSPDEGGCSLHVVPLLTKWGQPKPMEAEHGAKLLRRLSSISLNAEVNEDGNVVAETDHTDKER